MSLNLVPPVPPVVACQNQQGPTHQEFPDLPLGEVLMLSQQLGIQNPKMSEVQELSKIAEAFANLGLSGDKAASAAASLAGSNLSRRTQSTMLT